MRTLLAGLAVLVLAGAALGDGSTGARSTDAVAKEWIDEFEELGEGRKRSIEGQRRQLKILRDLKRAPCTTTKRFLLKLLAKRASHGDHRLYGMQALLEMADDDLLEDVVAALGKAKDPALWQAFGESLGRARGSTVRAWVTGAGLDARKDEALGACLDALARRPEPACFEALEDLYEKHAKKGEGDLAHRALRALVRTSGERARAHLLEATRHEDWRIRLAAADLLPAMEPFEGEVAAGVRLLLQDDEAYVRQTAARSAGMAKRKVLSDSLHMLLSDPHLRTRYVARQAIAAVGGEKPEDLTVPAYHGLPVVSDRVVFLVDASSSMTWPWRKEIHRIDVARAELERVLQELPPETRFNVVVYAEEPHFWKKEEALATPDHVKAALKWAKKAMEDPAGDTFLYEALEAAFEKNPHFDTLFLLTDGDPTAGRYYTKEGLTASVRAWTRYRRAAIHTVGLSLADEDRGMPNLAESLPTMKALLKALAAATSGEFREILRAP